MGKRHLSRYELNERNKQDKYGFSVAGKAHQILTLAVLVDEFDFTPEELNRYVTAYEQVLMYYNESDDYQKQLQEWNEYFKEYAGIKII